MTDPVLNEQQFMQEVAQGKQLSGEPLSTEVVMEAVNDESNFVKQDLNCFVAGTLVHTKDGLVPIEQIKAGDRVLSQPEQTGKLTYKQVEETFVNDDSEVWLVEYRIADQSYESWDEFDNDKWADEWIPKDENNELKAGYFVATGNHPVWLKGVGWTRVDELSWRLERGSSVLLTKDGRSLVVYDSRILYKSAEEGVGFVFSPGTGDPGPFVDLRNDKIVISEFSSEHIDLFKRSKGFHENPLKQKVYNFRVAEYSTYYIGEEGIWVHN